MALLDFGSDPETTGSIPDQGAFGTGLMSPEATRFAKSTLAALGQSLLTSTRQNPFQNFGTALAQQTKSNEEELSRKALEAVLIKSGMSPAEARTYSLNPTAAKLAIETNAAAKTQAASQKALGIVGGSDSGSDVTPRMTPPAPGGPAAGVSMTGDAPTDFVDTLIGKESGGNPNARNPNSSATGLTQFTSGTWNDMMQKHPDLGLTPDGRTDPDQARKAAIAYAKDNGQVLADAGHEVTPGNLYLGHFLGGPGASRFLSGLKDNPDAPAASYADPSAVAANSSVFKNPDGSYKTARQFYAERTSKFGQAPTQVASTDPLAGFVPSPGGGADNPDPGAAADRAARPVQVANDESQTQVLEGRMGMLPKSVYGIVPPTQTAAADAPIPGAAEAAFEIPPGAASTPNQRTQDKATALQTLSQVKRALMVPGISDDTRRVLEAQRTEAQAILKPTEIESKLLVSGLQPGTPEYQAAARRLSGVDKEDKDKLLGDARQRETLADQYGLPKGSPERNRFILLGELPKAEGASVNPYANPGGGKTTGEQDKSSGFADRMFLNEPIIRKLEAQGTDRYQRGVDGLPIVGSMLRSEDFTKFNAAKNNWIASQLRKESGAAIGANEYKDADAQYFPQPGDTPSVLEQKRALRQAATEAMARDGGPSYRPKAIFNDKGEIVPYRASQGGAEAPASAKADPASRFSALAAQGLTKEQAYARMRQEGY